MRDSYTRFIEQLERISAKMARAFERAMADVLNEVRFSDLMDAIERGDIEQAFRVLRMDQAAFAPVLDELEAAFVEGGETVIDTAPIRTVRGLGVRFDGRHDRAIEWMRNRGARLVDEMGQQAQRVIADTVADGLESNRGVRTVALDLVGTKGGGNSRRGGLLGLHTIQAGAVRNARRELREGNFSAYLRRERRDRSFDRSIAKAAREGTQLAASDIDKLTRRYSERLLKLRSENVARTETIGALNAGRYEAAAQMVYSGRLPESAVSFVWQSTPSRRTRDTHRAMNGQKIRFGEAFTSPSMARLRFPGDASLGAPASEIVNCRCGARTEVNWLSLAV
ncbi:phage minor head protein [Profundibacterium mesophilum]|uniref:Head morphogenesis protein n=1 Tax=Profundibacterium mesophilum KAUST100406-0324 TaxID=1037889 RepID=A0A921TB84_9RHOB|nr:phage minor head protein [Profundibacterium mesophilum]KAF0675075.1 putative Head morphogenesis protein [Profundibacterium mesophilum KAUST100406-0324]